jgi:hypothetical protein
MKKSSREWLSEIQSKIHLEIDVNNNKKCGWNLNDFNYSFHNELITLDEFKKRLTNSIIECNILELNEWLNNTELKLETMSLNDLKELKLFFEQQLHKQRVWVESMLGHDLEELQKRELIYHKDENHKKLERVNQRIKDYINAV